MEYVIVAFRSRSNTVKFNEILNRNNIPSEIISTPKEVGIGCGLSVKLSLNYLAVARKAVKMVKLNSFAGIFLVKRVGGGVFIKSI